MAEMQFFQFLAHDYLVRPVCWEEQGEQGHDEISLIMEKLEPVRFPNNDIVGSPLSSGISQKHIIIGRKLFVQLCLPEWRL